jgi:hypothetical protein
MALSDYAHHNEEQHAIWWLEEGQWYGREEFDEYDPDDYLPWDDEDESDDVDDILPEPSPHIAEDAHLEAAYEERSYDGGDY